jgi:beta-lactamase regulating signal transducer with metallopeptidase domain
LPRVPIPIGVYTHQGYRGIPMPPDLTQELWRLAPARQIEGLSPLSWGTALFAVYCSGVLILLIRLLISQRSVAGLVAAAEPLDAERFTHMAIPPPSHLLTRIRESPYLPAPVSSGLFRGYVLLPASWHSWSEDKLRAVLIHELTHVARRDSAVAFFIELTKCFLWFQPLVFVAARRRNDAVEEVCDDAVLEQDVDAEQYSQWVLEIAAATQGRQPGWLKSLPSMARSSRLGGRISRLLDRGRKFRALGQRSKLLLAAGGLAAIVLTTSSYLTAKVTTDRNSAGTSADMTAQAKQLELHLAEQPEDRDARNKLLLHYMLSHDDRRLVQHYFWMVEHYAESPKVRRINQNLFSLQALKRTNRYEEASTLWPALAAPGHSAQVLINAAAFIENRSTEEAHGIYQQAYHLAPANAEVLEAYGSFLAAAAEQSLAYQAGVRRRYWVPLDFGRIQAAQLKQELQNSADPGLLAAATHYLTVQSKYDRRVFGHDPDARQFGFNLCDRAAQLDPTNLHWRAVRQEFEKPVDLTKGHPTARFMLGSVMQSHIQVTPAELEDHLLSTKVAHIPLLAQLFHQAGPIRFRVTVSEPGEVISANILSGNVWLRGAAARALKDWRFAGFYRDGEAATVTSEVTVPVTAP